MYLTCQLVGLTGSEKVIRAVYTRVGQELKVKCVDSGGLPACPNISLRVCWQGLLFCELVYDSVKFTVLTDVLAAKHKEAQERPSMLLDLCSQRSNSKVSGDNEGMKQ